MHLNTPEEVSVTCMIDDLTGRPSSIVLRNNSGRAYQVRLQKAGGQSMVRILATGDTTVNIPSAVSLGIDMREGDDDLLTSWKMELFS